MATVTRTFTDTFWESTSYKKTWTVTATFADITVTGSSFTFVTPTITAKYSGGTSSPYIEFWSYVGGAKIGTYAVTGDTIGWRTRGQKSANTNFTVSKEGSSSAHSYTIPTASIFTASNKTTRTVNVVGGDGSGTDGYFAFSAKSASDMDSYGYRDNVDYYFPTMTWGSVTLNVPPTFTTTQLSFDTPYVYTGLTTASVTVSDLTAYYGGDISTATLTIGSQTVSRSDNGTLSILLNQSGTFTPTVTVTDSRGQTATQTLNAITVNSYTAPSVQFMAERTLATGVEDDEGTYATVDATFTFSDVVATLSAPTVTMVDDSGTQTTPTVTWYSTRATDGTLSGSVTWSSLSSGATVYGLISGLNTQHSYQVSITPRDSEGTGTAITQTVASAFYTIDFLAGGHGIAFGQPSSQQGFYCNMESHFLDDVYFNTETNHTGNAHFSSGLDVIVGTDTVDVPTWIGTPKAPEFLTTSTVINLGSYVGTAVLSSSGNQLIFSIPTGRVFPEGTTVVKLTGNLIARGSSANGGGYYFIKQSTSGGAITFDSSANFTFYNANNVQKTVTPSMWTNNLRIDGQTNIFAGITGSTNSTAYFFTGNQTITGYINNNAAVLQFATLQVTLNIPTT